MIETIFNIAFPLTVAASGMTLTLLVIAVNASTVAQREVIKVKVVNALMKLLEKESLTINFESLVSNLQEEKVGMVTIPDIVQQVREYRAYLSACIALAFALLMVVLLLELMITSNILPVATHQATLALCWLNIFIVLSYSALSVFMFQRFANWTDFLNTICLRY